MIQTLDCFPTFEGDLFAAAIFEDMSVRVCGGNFGMQSKDGHESKTYHQHRQDRTNKRCMYRHIAFFRLSVSRLAYLYSLVLWHKIVR